MLDILYEDNHVIVVNKAPGQLVQPDPSGEPGALEELVKAYIKTKYDKPGKVFLGVVHRIDRPVAGAVLFARTSKALVRLNEMLREHTGKIRKTYWAIVEKSPEGMNFPPSGDLKHYITRNGKTNRSYASPTPQRGDAKEAILRYRTLGGSDGNRYWLLEIDLITGRHHQIRAQLSAIGCPIKGDLKYGAARSNPDGSISLLARRLEFEHPVSRELITVTAPPTAGDNLWAYFAEEFGTPELSVASGAGSSKE